MNTVFVSGTIAEKPTQIFTADKSSHKIKTIVLCGACGAQEVTVGDNKTECPNCDEYIY